MQGEHSSRSSFLGMIYGELIPADHLLRKLTVAVAYALWFRRRRAVELQKKLNIVSSQL